MGFVLDVEARKGILGSDTWMQVCVLRGVWRLAEGETPLYRGSEINIHRDSKFIIESSKLINYICISNSRLRLHLYIYSSFCF